MHSNFILFQHFKVDLVLCIVEKPPATDPIERITKHKSNPETKQLGVSKTVPKLSHAAPTPPTLGKPRRGKRRQERSMDPPFEFR